MTFDSPLAIIDVGTNQHGRQEYRLTEPLTFGGLGGFSENGGRYGLRVHVPVGFQTDFASVPRFLWWLFPPQGRGSRAAVVHDYLCVSQACSRFMADAIFREGMRELGVPWWRRVSMYYAVRGYSICRGVWRTVRRYAVRLYSICRGLR